jgi:hypothetical protein
MSGYRINDAEAQELANIFLCELLWVLRKIERGELVAAQGVLHKKLQETNVVLLHELRLRKELPTFQQARRVEKLVSAAELATIQINARLNKVELTFAAWSAKEGLLSLMGELVPRWQVPVAMGALLEYYAPNCGN